MVRTLGNTQAPRPQWSSVVRFGRPNRAIIDWIDADVELGAETAAVGRDRRLGSRMSAVIKPPGRRPLVGS